MEIVTLGETKMYNAEDSLNMLSFEQNKAGTKIRADIEYGNGKKWLLRRLHGNGNFGLIPRSC